MYEYIIDNITNILYLRTICLLHYVGNGGRNYIHFCSPQLYLVTQITMKTLHI